MSGFETAAYARMLDEALARHLRSNRHRVPVRLPTVTSYVRLATELREWGYSAAAVLLRDSGTAVRLASAAELEEEPWPPQGVLAAADGTWVLEPDGRVTRLY